MGHSAWVLHSTFDYCWDHLNSILLVETLSDKEELYKIARPGKQIGGIMDFKTGQVIIIVLFGICMFISGMWEGWR